MNLLTLNAPFSKVFKAEIESIADFYHLHSSAIIKAINPVIGNFENYWEMVFSNDGFELITAGTNSDFIGSLESIAIRQGLTERTVNLFEKCREYFPDVICGIKLAFTKNGNSEPTLYVRTKTENEHAFAFLSNHFSISDISRLKEALKDNSILYGLGFSEKQGEPYLKTYTINPVKNGDEEETMGFVSHRLYQHQVNKEHKTYLPEVSLPDFEPEDPKLKQLQQFLVEKMQYTTAGHVGMLYQDGVLKDTKIYVERVGGIPTDFLAR